MQAVQLNQWIAQQENTRIKKVRQIANQLIQVTSSSQLTQHLKTAQLAHTASEAPKQQLNAMLENTPLPKHLLALHVLKDLTLPLLVHPSALLAQQVASPHQRDQPAATSALLVPMLHLQVLKLALPALLALSQQAKDQLLAMLPQLDTLS